MLSVLRSLLVRTLSGMGGGADLEREREEAGEGRGQVARTCALYRLGQKVGTGTSTSRSERNSAFVYSTL